MTVTMKEAIAAARAGDSERAQLLVAEIIQSDPNDPHAWYLMSQLVDSDARRATYLHKTLQLDPSHERARIEFSALPTEVIDQLSSFEPSEIEEPSAIPVEGVSQPEPPEWLRPLAPEAETQKPVITSVPSPTEEPVLATRENVLLTPSPTTSGQKPAPIRRNNLWLIALWVLLGLLTLLVLGLLAFLLIS
ncbi:MAG: hypothetical protein R6X18_02845 [Chloroflexota bacterium]|jgi:hypothetical protein